MKIRITYLKVNEEARNIPKLKEEKYNVKRPTNVQRPKICESNCKGIEENPVMRY
jgi:hypothetical protein